MYKILNRERPISSSLGGFGLGLLLIFGNMFSPVANAQVGMGLAGDSIIDDYLGPALPQGGNTNLAAGSFGQILGALRSDQIDFGAYMSPDDGTWDTIRYSGYEYNWATAGAAANPNAVIKLNFSPPQLPPATPVTFPVNWNLGLQVAGLAPLITSGDIDAAVIMTGGNDFFYRANVIDTVGGGLMPATDFPGGDGEIDAGFIDDLANSILSGVDTLQAAGDVDIVLATLPKIPAIMNQDALDGVDAVNAILLAGAADRGVAIFDVDVMSWSSVGTNIDPVTGDVTVGDILIEFASIATGADIGVDGDGLFCNFEGLCSSASHTTKYLAEDGQHLNTLIQGLMANEIIGIFNNSYGYNIDPLTDQEMLSLVDTRAIPVPASAWLLCSALGVLGWMRRKAA